MFNVELKLHEGPALCLPDLDQVLADITDVHRQSDLVLDDETSMDMVADLCRDFYISRRVEFIISGFGEARWPAPLQPYLSIFLDEFYLFTKWLSGTRDDDFELLIIEQELQCAIMFNNTPSGLQLTCSSYTDWQPSQLEEFMPVRDLIENCERMVSSIYVCAKTVAPVVFYSRPFRVWIYLLANILKGPEALL